MKNKYLTPIIKIEELVKLDVLCESGEISGFTKNGKYNIEDTARSWTLEDTL